MSEESTFKGKSSPAMTAMRNATRALGPKYGAIFLIPDADDPDEVYVRVLERQDPTPHQTFLTEIGLQILNVVPPRNYFHLNLRETVSLKDYVKDADEREVTESVRLRK